MNILLDGAMRTCHWWASALSWLSQRLPWLGLCYQRMQRLIHDSVTPSPAWNHHCAPAMWASASGSMRWHLPKLGSLLPLALADRRWHLIIDGSMRSSMAVEALIHGCGTLTTL